MTERKFVQLPNIRNMVWNQDPSDGAYFIYLKYVKGYIIMDQNDDKNLYYEEVHCKISDRKPITKEEALALAYREDKMKTFE